MNQESRQGPRATADDSRGNAWKWLAGAAAAAVLLGGGYYAWTQMRPTEPGSEVAYNAPYSSEPFLSDESPQARGATASAASDASPSPAASKETRTAAAPAPRRVTARAAAIPEEVVGVAPVSTTAEDSEAIVVPGARRPVWSRRPNTRRLSTLYPARLLDRGREGEASVRCTVENNGALDCVRVSETQAGFGAAALRVARLFRHAPERWDGSAASGSTVNLRVIFRLADEDRRR